MTRKSLKGLLRKTEAVQVNQIWMKIQCLYLQNTHGVAVMLRPMGVGVPAVEVTWEQLKSAKVKNSDELVLLNGTRLRFFKLEAINLTHAG